MHYEPEYNPPIEVGDSVMLISYEQWSDYKEHRGQVGIIFAYESLRALEMPWGIRWADGRTSSAKTENLIQCNPSKIKKHGTSSKSFREYLQKKELLT